MNISRANSRAVRTECAVRCGWACGVEAEGAGAESGGADSSSASFFGAACAFASARVSASSSRRVPAGGLLRASGCGSFGAPCFRGAWQEGSSTVSFPKPRAPKSAFAPSTALPKFAAPPSVAMTAESVAPSEEEETPGEAVPETAEPPETSEPERAAVPESETGAETAPSSCALEASGLSFPARARAMARKSRPTEPNSRPDRRSSPAPTRPCARPARVPAVTTPVLCAPPSSITLSPRRASSTGRSATRVRP